MNRKRHGDHHEHDDIYIDRRAVNRTISPSRDAMEGSPGPMRADEFDGQLGPDELPDADEVAMNQEAKLHH